MFRIGWWDADLPRVKRCLTIAWITIAWIMAAWLTPVWSATLERLSMDEMIAKSTSIVRGSVSDTWTTFTGRDIYTHYKIDVLERFKGASQKSVEVTVPGGTYGSYHQTPSGSPLLNKGDQYLFFLWTSQGGVTWIMGMTQGLFLLDASQASDPVVTRSASRELMLDPSTGRPVKDSAISFKLSDLRSRISSRLSPGGSR
jgi:hypothetical protein